MLCNKCCVSRNTKKHFFGTLLADPGGREDKGYRKSLSKGWRLTNPHTILPAPQSKLEDLSPRARKARPRGFRRDDW